MLKIHFLKFLTRKQIQMKNIQLKIKSKSWWIENIFVNKIYKFMNGKILKWKF